MTLFRPSRPFNLSPLPPELKQEILFESDLTRLVIKANRTIGELNGLCQAIRNAYPLFKRKQRCEQSLKCEYLIFSAEPEAPIFFL